MSNRHDLKIHELYFDDVANGSKTFEVRLNDRNYSVGDLLVLREFTADNAVYTGRCLFAIVSYVLDNSDYCKNGYLILGLNGIIEVGGVPNT